jgi:hypothetical protein
MKLAWLSALGSGVAVGWALLLGACSSDAEAPRDVGAAGAAGESGEAPPAILLVERVFAPNTRTYYVSVLSEMPTGPVDRSKAREFGSADIEAFDGAYYLRSREDNSMTRFTVNARNELVEGDRFSFQDTGLSVRRFHTAFISKTQAYTIDNVGWRLIEWNPTLMELTGREVALDYLQKKGLPDTQIAPPVRVGDRLIGGIMWEDGANKVVYPGAGGLVFEPSGDAPTLVEQPHVGGVYKVSDSEGAAYFSGIVYGSALFRTVFGGGKMPVSGLVRIGAGQQEFDADYLVDLSEITGSPSIYGVHRVDDGHTLVQMFDPESPTDIYETEDDFMGASEYIYGLVDNEARTWKRIEEIPKAGAGNSLSHVVDGTLYVQAYDLSGEAALIYAVDSEGVTPAFSVPTGDLWYVNRLR